MANYIQPNAPLGAYLPELIKAACPTCGLTGRVFGSAAFNSKCDNNHQFEPGGAVETSAQIQNPTASQTQITTVHDIAGSSSFKTQDTKTPQKP